METNFFDTRRHVPRIDCKCYDSAANVGNFLNQRQHQGIIIKKEQETFPNKPTMIEERMHVLIEWFAEWDELNKIRFIDLLMDRSHPNLIRYMKYETTRRLRHSVEVSGYWKYLSESNEIWEGKARATNLTLPDGLSSGNSLNAEATGFWKISYKQYVHDVLAQRSKPTKDSQHATKIPKPRQHRRQKTVVIEERRTEQTVILDHTHNHWLSRDGDKPDNYTLLENFDEEADRPRRNQSEDQPEAPTPPPRRRHNKQSASNSRSGERRVKSAVTPWRPSAARPEDTHFDKFDKKNARRSSTTRRLPMPSEQGLRSVSSMRNIADVKQEKNYAAVPRSSSNRNLQDQAASSNGYHHYESSVYFADEDKHNTAHQAFTIQSKSAHKRNQENTLANEQIERHIHLQYKDDGPFNWRYMNSGLINDDASEDQNN